MKTRIQTIGFLGLFGLLMVGCAPTPYNPPVSQAPSAVPPAQPETPTAPPVQTPPAQTTRPKPQRPPVAQRPYQPPSQPIVKWQQCNALGRGYTPQVTMETDSYFINICQQGDSGNLMYFGQDKFNRDRNLRLPATAAERGFQANNGNTTYAVQQNNNGRWVLTVRQNGRQVLREPAMVAYSNPNSPQEPGSVTLTCSGEIGDVVTYTLRYTDEHGFNNVQVQNRNTGQRIATGNLDFVGQNEQGQPIFKGNAGEADFTVVSLQAPMRSGGQISASYDGQWGRGVCN